MLDIAQQARKSALSVGSVLLAMSLWSIYREHSIRATVLMSLAVILLFLGLFVPRWAVPFHIAWMKMAAALGYVNSRILLGILFYFVFTPIGLVMKLFGNDPLNRRRKASSSYWIIRERTHQSQEGFQRLF